MRWILGWLFIASVWGHPMHSKLIKLHYIQADVVLPLAQSLLKKGETINGAEQWMVLNASPETLTAIRVILQQMDVKPATFRISVYQGNLRELTTNDKQYSTDFASQSSISSVNVGNGQTAEVLMEQDVPVISALSYGLFTGIAYQSNKIRHGLFLRPLLKGSLVQIRIYKINQKQDIQQYQTFVGQEIDTTLLVPLNQWTSISETIHSSQNTYSTNHSQLNKTIYIKVTEAH